MNIYVEIMSIYGITFLVSMFVAFIIWGLAKLVDALPDEPFSIKGLLKKVRQNIISGKAERKQFLKEIRDVNVERNNDLVNFHHGHA